MIYNFNAYVLSKFILGQIIPMSMIENLPLYSDKEIVGYRVAMKNETTAK